MAPPMRASARLCAQSYWQCLPQTLLDQTPTPMLTVFMDVVRHNISTVISRAGGPSRWRPHLKTTKMPSVWAELLGAGLRSFKCATVREARIFLDTVHRCGVPGVDLLVAYPLAAPSARKLGELAANLDPALGTRVAVVAEDAAAVTAMPPSLGIWLDVNPAGPTGTPQGSYDRTGCPVADAVTQADAVRSAGPRFCGVHYYDGHSPGPGTYDALLRAVDALPLESTRFSRPEEIPLVTSGTPAFEDALDYPPLALRAAVHQVSPGTVVFTDGRTLDQTASELGLQPAALVLTTVVSLPGEGKATADAGSKSLAAEVGDPCATVLGRPDVEALRPSEEHLPLAWNDAAPPRRGEPLLLLPEHICPTVNLAEWALVLEGGRKPRMEAVDARAH